MSVATVDAMAGGNRFIAGIGVSGPQIVEGWYGEPWGKPYYRIRDYVQIMRKIFERERPVMHEGREISLPYGGEGSSGLGKPLRSILHMNPNIPSGSAPAPPPTLASPPRSPTAGSPSATSPARSSTHFMPWLDEGFRRAGGGKSLDDLEIQVERRSQHHRDVQGGALDAMKPGTALYIGGMGHRTKNFHNDNMVRRATARSPLNPGVRESLAGRSRGRRRTYDELGIKHRALGPSLSAPDR